MRIAHRNQGSSLLRWLAAALFALLLGSCASDRGMMDDLNSTLLDYEKAVRWAQFETVYSYHKWEADQEQQPPDSMENIRVTKYSASGEKFDQKNKIMKQTVTLRYYNTDELRERTIKHRHEWKYFPKLERWLLISDPIAFP